MALAWPAKDPDEVLDYDIDWTSRLLSADELEEIEAGDDSVEPSDAIVTSSWIVVGSIVLQSDSKTDTATKAWLSGGELDETCVLTNRIVTAAGRTMDQSVKIKIKAK